MEKYLVVTPFSGKVLLILNDRNKKIVGFIKNYKHETDQNHRVRTRIFNLICLYTSTI